MKRDLKTRERMLHAWLTAFLKANLPDAQLVYNKRVGECYDDRPDWLVDALSHGIGIECDENQHAGEAEECRARRQWRVFESLGNRPVVFLRFNPDGYTDKHGVRHPSCFKRASSGAIVLAIENEWARRTQLLAERIMHHVRNVPDVHMTTETLFYDDASAPKRSAPDFAGHARRVKQARSGSDGH